MEENIKVNEMNLIADNLTVAKGPFLRCKKDVSGVMLDVIIAMVPAMIGAAYFFGIKAVMLMAVSVVSCVVFEALAQKMFGKPIRIKDLSAVVTGILIAFNVPAETPFWVMILGAAFAIIIVKECFGGIGSNFMNPALAARAALMTSFPKIMTTYTGPDAIATATPLQIMKKGSDALPPLKDMAIGNIPGVIGETSAILLIIGAVYLIIRGIIDWKVPVVYIGAFSLVCAGLGVGTTHLAYHILGGGLILGAFFMATDYPSTPSSSAGRVIFAIGCGVITALIRIKGGMPEGTSYAILVMNVATPLIDKMVSPRVFGEVRSKK